MEEKKEQKLAIYQAENGAIALREDFDHETIWATQKQMAEVFDVEIPTINEHIKNIFKSEELNENSTIRNFLIVQKEGKRDVSRDIEHYNLDMIISVGYRVNSKTATNFRKWATQTLAQHITKGYTINERVLQKNYKEFLETVEDLKLLAQDNEQISHDEILELVKSFSATWFNLESYDKQNLPKKGVVKREMVFDVDVFSQDLYREIDVLKTELIAKKEATDLFAQEKSKNALQGILGNVFQSVFDKDVYGTIEEKAAHLLYFVIKNHPFTDGNKRSGAFAFIWFLQKMHFDFRDKITPATLTALALLIAESNPKDMEKMIGLILLLLKK